MFRDLNLDKSSMPHAIAENILQDDLHSRPCAPGICCEMPDELGPALPADILGTLKNRGLLTKV